MTLLMFPYRSLPVSGRNAEGRRWWRNKSAKLSGHRLHRGFRHGISEDLIRKTYDVSGAFFSLPVAEKIKADRPAPASGAWLQRGRRRGAFIQS